jgi:uncharacterized protein
MTVIIEKNVQVAMRDGVALATDIYRPGDDGAHPTVMIRLPYNKELSATLSSSLDVMRAVGAGYAVVAQDTRGRYASGGVFNPFFDEAADGADAIAWAAAQPWSDGSVGMAGGSYFGATQWLAATEAPPALRAIAPMITTDQYYDGWAYQGGAFQLGFNLHWTLGPLATGEVVHRMASGTAGPDDLAARTAAVDANNDLYCRLPLTGLPGLAEIAPYYDEWLAHPTYDAHWRNSAPRESYAEITVPALNIGGWHDLFLKGTLANYTGMKAGGGSEAARGNQRLVIGPWAHGALTGWFPSGSYGARSSTEAADITGLQLRWFNWWLRGEDDGISQQPPVRLFVMGANVWRDEADWPLPDTSYESWYLHSAGRANTLDGDGSLSPSAPGGEEPEDVYLYDPRQPVPTVGGPTFLPGLFIGANAGPRDQRGLEARADVLCYTSAPLDEPLEVIGPLQLVLFVSSSAVDTDFTGKLVDVWPDGRAVNLIDGILRARYRRSFTDPSLLEPGEIYEVTVDLVATANVFATGHRLRVEVSSSNFPRFDRNTNTGGTIATESEGDFRQAVNRIHHGPSHPSRLVLPVIRR